MGLRAGPTRKDQPRRCRAPSAVRAEISGGAWLRVPGRRPSLWSRARSGFSGCAEAPTSLRGPASALVAALPSHCPVCPGLVTARKRQGSQVNGESPGLPHLCPLPTKA